MFRMYDLVKVNLAPGSTVPAVVVQVHQDMKGYECRFPCGKWSWNNSFFFERQVVADDNPLENPFRLYAEARRPAYEASVRV